MDSFIANADAWNAAGTWATFLVLSVTLYFVYQQVAEAARLRREQTRPYVVVSVDVEQQSLFMLTVENVGSTPAFDVVVDFDEPPRSNLKEIEELRMLKEPIPMLPPGRKFRASWEVSLTCSKMTTHIRSATERLQGTPTTRIGSTAQSHMFSTSGCTKDSQ